MAATLPGVLDESLREKIDSSRILLVGAGGIGCELLKNLVLTGFRDIEVIDLDTIDVSNLNRQFLFRKEHVGKSKSKVAKESALLFNPDVKITAHHDSIISSDYGTNFFKQFTMVLNALDNRAARNHVNRMCLAVDVPLIESGSAGYLGQATVIKKGLTECYECQPKPAQKTYPGCTIRNTPSEPIHCIVWAKHLFNQLFGEEDPDQDVSPDTEDPELAGEAGKSALAQEAKGDSVGGIERKSTRTWAMETGYDGLKIFNKLFKDDITYLLSMEKLWEKRRPPTPLDWDTLSDTADPSTQGGLCDQRIWSMKECARRFSECLQTLRGDLEKHGDGGMLVWDKDDDTAMDFVTCAANIRSHIFNIPTKSKFDIKSMAGNIIPAIATTNAVIAALIVMESLKILSGRIDDCKAIYFNRQPNFRKKLLVPCAIPKPNPKCYVCSSKPEVTVALNTGTTTVKTLQDKIMKSSLGMAAPDVEIDDGKGTILISSEEGETDDNAEKFLSDFGIQDGTRLKCDDFLQEYELVVNIIHVETLPEEQEFDVVGDVTEFQSSLKQVPSNAENGTGPSTSENGTGPSTSENGTAVAAPTNAEVEDLDDLMMIDDEEEDGDDIAMETVMKGTKRKVHEDEEEEESVEEIIAAKKAKIAKTGATNGTVEVPDDDVVVL